MTDDYINLDDPKFGTRLLSDPISLPLDAFEMDVMLHHNPSSTHCFPVEEWTCPDWKSIPRLRPLKPQDAVHEVYPLMSKILSYLNRPRRPAFRKASEVVRQASDILERAQSSYQRRRGREADMRPMAVRAYMIRKFNPDPNQKGESTVELGQARRSTVSSEQEVSTAYLR